MNGIVKAVTETVPGVEDAGVSLREGKALRTVAMFKPPTSSGRLLAFVVTLVW